MAIPVVQLGTGNVGIHSLRALITNPEFELTGVWVSSDAKVGKDAAVLAGLADSMLRLDGSTPASRERIRAVSFWGERKYVACAASVLRSDAYAACCARHSAQRCKCSSTASASPAASSASI